MGWVSKEVNHGEWVHLRFILNLVKQPFVLFAKNESTTHTTDESPHHSSSSSSRALFTRDIQDSCGDVAF